MTVPHNVTSGTAGSQPERPRFIQRALLAGCCGLGVWLVGLIVFLVFIQLSAQPVEALPDRADAIIVLTGGSGRIEAGVSLLRSGRGDRLYISGVNDPDRALNLGNADPSLSQDRPTSLNIEIGPAQSTFENVQEISHWVQANNINSVVLVTAFYHMPRSLVLLEERLPMIRFYPYRVVPGRLSTFRGWAQQRHLRLLISEYHKLLATYIDARLRIGLWVS